MRLYNAKSCTPVGITAKKPSPRNALPQSPTVFAQNWRLQKNKNTALQNKVSVKKRPGIASSRQESEIASAFFDPFDFDDCIVHFPSDFAGKKGDSFSSATSATEKLTPVVSSGSHELFPTTAPTDEEFVTFQDPFAETREIDFEASVEGELFNDASTWMTSSTLSTKFTSHEMLANTFKKGPAHRVLSSRRVFQNGPHRSSRALNTEDSKRPDEVFVMSPQPEFAAGTTTTTFLQLDSKAVAPGSEKQWWKKSIDDGAFDPFETNSHMPRPVTDNDEDFDKENLPTQYLPHDYMVTNADPRSVSNEAHHSPPFKSKHRMLHKKNAITGALLKPSKEINIASVPKKEVMMEPTTAWAGITADRNRAQAHFDSFLIGRPSLSSGPKAPSIPSDRQENSKIETKGNRVLSGTFVEGTVEGRSRSARATNVPTLHRQIRLKNDISASLDEKNVLPSADDVRPVRSNGPISAAVLASGRARLSKATAAVPTEIPKVTCAGAPGSFLAERVEANRPEAVFRPPENSSPASSDRCELSDSETIPTPSIAKVNDSTRSIILQDMLSKRFGKTVDERGDATELPCPSTAQLNIRDEKVKQKTETKSLHVSDDKLALKDDPKYAKYFKMLKMGLPMGAIKNVMERDGVDPSIMDGDHSLPAEQKTSGVVPLKDDPKYAKYFKMLKMGLPMGAVKNAMERDGIDASIMDGDHSLPPGQQTSGAVPLKDDPKYTKYFKMLKMGLPMGAVKNAMERDGVDSSIMDGDHSAPPRGAKHGKNDKVAKDKFRRTRVHWETHNTIRSNTIWAMVSRDPDVSQLHVDEEEFCNLFQAESKPSARQSPSKTTEKGAVKVIDKKRANNGGITLARIKLSYEDIARVVDSYDDSCLTQEQIRGIIQYLPTSEEKTALRSFLDGDMSTVDDLCECEKFMVAIMTVKHAKRKLNAILYMQKFASSLEELRRDARLVQKACDEIMGSSRFRKTLGIVLNIGNRLNTAGSVTKEPAEAVTLESLLKLNQPKAFDKKTTFLQYVATVVRRNNASLCHFKDDLAAVFIAEKILWDGTLAELKRMEDELESVRRLALYHALEKDHARASAWGSVGDDSVAAMSIPHKLSVEEEIRLLGMTSIGNFTLDACAEMAAVVDEIKNAKTSYNALLLYFGEEDNTSAQPNDVFRTISAFSKDFEAALAVVVETEKAELREAKLSRKHHAAVLPSVSEESEGSTKSNEPLRRRVSSGMGGVLNELRKPNLKWRRRKHVP